MEWWNGLVRWFSSADGEYVVSNLVLPAAAIIVAGLLAAWIAHSSVKRLLAKHDRELKISAIAALIDAAEQASVWNSLTPQEQILSDRASGQADIQVRLLPIKGSDVAANWAAHCLAEMKRESATFGYRIEPAVIEFRDRLIEWQQRPARSKRLFQADLERWAAADSTKESELASKQDEWVAQQHHEQFARPDAAQGRPEQRSAASNSAPTASARPDYTDVPTQATPIMPSSPLAPTHEPRPIVQQVASGTGTRGMAPRKPIAAGPRGAASPLGTLENTVDPGDDARASGDVPPPVHAFPPRAGSTD
ncbi:hypothetical protein [Herbiconiux flava]|uniref:Uncharacterized protein n=1 Tax=Herbiconiux flava TaxID=881268 RepID=A0A852SPL8_9MICO|nr:hypothetical protein [Herbiconiux flava]NYD70757.1 hypothetical protein [Herbiconiux flava]GLK17516.1 hypothetical protein GCM10017602_19980 [Herbiconiux flava]